MGTCSSSELSLFVDIVISPTKNTGDSSHGYLELSVITNPWLSAVFKAGRLMWYEAGLMSGGILAFLCAARGIAKQSCDSTSSESSFREDGSYGAICKSPVNHIHAIHSLFVQELPLVLL